MSKLANATVRYLKNAIEVVKANAEMLEPAHVGMIGKGLKAVAMNNSMCSDWAAEDDHWAGWVGDLQDPEFDAQLDTESEVTS